MSVDIIGITSCSLNGTLQAVDGCTPQLHISASFSDTGELMVPAGYTIPNMHTDVRYRVEEPINIRFAWEHIEWEYALQPSGIYKNAYEEEYPPSSIVDCTPGTYPPCCIRSGNVFMKHALLFNSSLFQAYQVSADPSVEWELLFSTSQAGFHHSSTLSSNSSSSTKVSHDPAAWENLDESFLVHNMDNNEEDFFAPISVFGDEFNHIGLSKEYYIQNHQERHGDVLGFYTSINNSTNTYDQFAPFRSQTVSTVFQHCSFQKNMTNATVPDIGPVLSVQCPNRHSQVSLSLDASDLLLQTLLGVPDITNWGLVNDASGENEQSLYVMLANQGTSDALFEVDFNSCCALEPNTKQCLSPTIDPRQPAEQLVPVGGESVTWIFKLSMPKIRMFDGYCRLSISQFGQQFVSDYDIPWKSTLATTSAPTQVSTLPPTISPTHVPTIAPTIHASEDTLHPTPSATSPSLGYVTPDPHSGNCTPPLRAVNTTMGIVCVQCETWEGTDYSDACSAVNVPNATAPKTGQQQSRNGTGIVWVFIIAAILVGGFLVGLVIMYRKRRVTAPTLPVVEKSYPVSMNYKVSVPTKTAEGHPVCSPTPIPSLTEEDVLVDAAFPLSPHVPHHETSPASSRRSEHAE